MSSCHLYESSKDTAENPIYSLRCFCNTTACQRLNEFTLTTCDHYWFKCEPETDDIEHCRNCGRHRKHSPLNQTKDEREQ